MYTSFVSKVLFPLHERLKKHSTVKVRQSMESDQWSSLEDINRLQVERLKKFLTDVAHYVPYYRSLFKEIGFDPSKLTTLQQLATLPLTDKSTIRKNLEGLKSEKAEGLARFNTGGSSGEPLIFYIGKERVSHDVAAKWRATRWWGVDIGDPEIVIWGSPIELGAQDKIRQIRDNLLRTHLLPAFEMSDTKLAHFVDEIRRIRPKMLFGYPSALAHIAAYAQKNNIRLDDLGIKVAFVTSERLYDHQRKIIETVFNCPVANGYGGRDAGFIAHECPEGSMHITADDIIVEIIDPQGNPVPIGESGEIVVTHLATSDFPFIRYRTGDIGALSDRACPCGRGLPILQKIQGRSTDFVIAQDGTVLHGLALIYVLRDLPGVKAFKIVQETLNRTVVYIVKGTEYSESSDETIKDVFHQRLGHTVEIELCYVDKIEKEKSGKFRYVVSHVKQQ